MPTYAIGAAVVGAAADPADAAAVERRDQDVSRV